MAMKMRRLLSMALAVVLLLSCGLLAACGSDDNSGGGGTGTSFTYWISRGEDASFYETYQDNPTVQYSLKHAFDAYEGGDPGLEVEFWQPITGSETDNFNTLLGTGEYADILDMAVFSGSVIDLYNDGIAMDLTYYVENYMPNYLAYLEAHPEVAITATNLVDGERKYLQLYNYSTAPSNWGGYSYRRDWIIKYGVNPIDGSAFSGDYAETNADGTPNKESWADNVVFPSGETSPVYISDWEWMLGIFATAIEDLGITDGYCMSLYYPGFTGTGDLACAFGGGNPVWYIDESGQITFGGDGEDFRVYLQAMSTWYQNGWIDKAFPEHASDLFYRIDDAKVRQGKVGLWYGTESLLLGRLDDGEGLTDGIMVYTARQPINDIYGGPDQQNTIPYTMFQNSLESTSVIITDKAKDKDLKALFTWLDYLYGVEGGMLRTFGFSKGQYEETQDTFYTREGLTEGAYYAIETDEGTKYDFVEKVNDGGTLVNAVRALRVVGLQMTDEQVFSNPYIDALMKEWVYYDATGQIPMSFTGQLSPEDGKAYSKNYTNVVEFMNKNVPPFIQGAKDPFSDTDWDAFVSALGKYGPDSATQILQALLEQLRG